MEHHPEKEEEEVKESYQANLKKQKKKVRTAEPENSIDDLENEEDQLVNEIDSFLIDDDEL